MKKRRLKTKKERKDSSDREMKKMIDAKICLICRSKENDENFLLCDSCDDAYHLECLNIQGEIGDTFVCPRCIEIKDKQQQILPKNCGKCIQTLLDSHPLLIRNEKGIDSWVFLESKPLKCLCCEGWFHERCFNYRQNSLNCTLCERNLRMKTPKTEQEWSRWTEHQLRELEKSNYTLLPMMPPLINNEAQRERNLHLKMPSIVADPEHRMRQRASIFYAFMSKKLIYCNDQAYRSKEIAELNNYTNEVLTVHMLHEKDEDVYREYKSKQNRFFFCNVEIRQDRVKGFFVQALGDIGPGMILSEYSGEVEKDSEAAVNIGNDSIFKLLVGPASINSLSICPEKFSSLARFIMGINNTLPNQKKLVNVKSIRFVFNGRLRIILVAKKHIKAGQVLYLDYNSGMYYQYPTSDFVQ